MNGCNLEPVVTEEPDCVIERYEPLRGAKGPSPHGAPVVLYRLLEGGHTWPGGVDVTARFNTGKLIASVDASTIMWRFFEKFTL